MGENLGDEVVFGLGLQFGDGVDAGFDAVSGGDAGNAIIRFGEASQEAVEVEVVVNEKVENLE